MTPPPAVAPSATVRAHAGRAWCLAERESKDMREEQRPMFDPSPGWVSQDRHAAMTVLWFAVGIAIGLAFGWGVAR